MSDHFVYILNADTDTGEGPVKIGISRSIAVRIRNLQTACPFKISLVHYFAFPEKEMAAYFEQAFHFLQSKHRTSGEWFKMNPIIALEIMCLYIDEAFKMRLPEDYGFMDEVREKCGLIAARQKLALWASSAGTLQ